jgi:cell wall-associated NlpC family hydrolase
VNAGVKVVVIGALGCLLAGVFALVGLVVMVQKAAARTCTPTAFSVSASPSAAALSLTSTPSPTPSAAPSASAPPASCDDGDGLPDSGATGIPAGLVLPSNAQQAIAVAFALAQLGKPYVFGATGPNSYDCSGLVMTAWAKAAVRIPRITGDQVHTGIAVTNLAAMQPGDLIFIPGSDGTMAHPGHVGMYIGTIHRRQLLVQAPHTGTVVKTVPVSSWANQIAAIRRPASR